MSAFTQLVGLFDSKAIHVVAKELVIFEIGMLAD